MSKWVDGSRQAAVARTPRVNRKMAKTKKTKKKKTKKKMTTTANTLLLVVWTLEVGKKAKKNEQQKQMMTTKTGAMALAVGTRRCTPRS